MERMRSLEILQAGVHEWQSVCALAHYMAFETDSPFSEIYTDRKLAVLANIKQFNQDLDRVIKGCVTSEVNGGSRD
jgi:hypothetical protein